MLDIRNCDNMELMAQHEIMTSQREKIEHLTKKANVIHNRIKNSIDSSLAYFSKHYIVRANASKSENFL